MKEAIMHKDLSDLAREGVELLATSAAYGVAGESGSLAIAREALINAFDKAAEELDSTVAKEAEVGE